jgi:hypothetical protein
MKETLVGSVQVGRNRKPSEHLRVIERAGITVTDGARALILSSSFPRATEVADCTVVAVSVRDHGFPDGGKLARVYKSPTPRGLRSFEPEYVLWTASIVHSTGRGAVLYPKMNPLMGSRIPKSVLVFVTSADGSARLEVREFHGGRELLPYEELFYVKI